MLPYIDGLVTINNIEYNVTYSIDSLITFIMLVRFYLVIRLLTRFTKWQGKRAQIFCNREGIEADTVFALKCLLKERPVIVLTTTFVFATFIFAFAVRCAEIPYYDTAEASSSEFDVAKYYFISFYMSFSISE